ncbi:GNAT family N-acetyltransferase [Macrococcus capreoli]|uniref:GNAT family N-acetyltransferase n=1 Tax=Macrococcus capreoli TaxID=2982690 RepID=UPI0021D59F51|nr:GNAT family N-acetyltransferase [Macrococcus sp. TMW 2.2395]MCU7556171.1 GNAT family N-acetyltransferase [Macrococcus sp. TMW 2.2395]
MYTIRPMTAADAEQILTWHYAPPYDFYNIVNTEEHPADILNATIRTNHFYSVYQNELIGLIELHYNKHICTLGLGLKPEYTGKGYGESFINSAIQFIQMTYPETKTIALAVATFNERAIKVYERCGFIEVDYELMVAHGVLHEFLKMQLKL